MAIIAGLMAGSLIGLGPTHSGTIKQRPCDIYAAAKTPCVAAHSTVRSLYAKYAGALYRGETGVRRRHPKHRLAFGRLRERRDARCILRKHHLHHHQNLRPISKAQRPRHLLRRDFKGPGPNGSDLGAAADALPVTAGGHQVYGVSISPGMGYRNNRTSGVAVNGKPEGMYMVSSGTHFNSGCCFDYGNAETSGTDTGAGHMDAVNVSRDLNGLTASNKPEPGVHADLENGVFPLGPTNLQSRFVCQRRTTSLHIGMVEEQWSDEVCAEVGRRTVGRPQHNLFRRPSDADMRRCARKARSSSALAAIIVHASAGSFFEGVMTSGYPTDSAENAVQANIVAVGYGAPTGLSGTLAPGSEISLQAATACCTGDYVRNRNGAAVIAPITSGSAEQDKGDATWIVRRGLADNSCVSFNRETIRATSCGIRTPLYMCSRSTAPP